MVVCGFAVSITKCLYGGAVREYVRVRYECGFERSIEYGVRAFRGQCGGPESGQEAELVGFLVRRI